MNDLKGRLRDFRRVPLADGIGWDRGTDANYLAELVDHWAGSYDWRRHEERILSYPWVLTEVGGTALRSIHQTADAAAPTVVLLHGWPDSFLRFERVLPLLTDVNVVVPCLPGYPYADPSPSTGLSATAMADVIAGSLAELGVDRYVVSGGDIGSVVAEAMARQHAGHVEALHLTDLPYLHLFSVDADDLSTAEQKYLADGQAWQRSEGAYALAAVDQAAHARGRTG